jgi:prephenate dehydrogenase
VYFGKVEHSRQDRQTKQDKGEGNMHVHIIVSRRDQQQWHKLSPYNNAKEEYETSNKIKSGGFNRNAFREASEKVFDSKFQYQRDITESFQYQNTMKNGKFEDQVQLLQESKRQEKTQQIQQDQKRAPEIKRGKGLGL